MPTQAERNGDLTALGGPVIPSSINPTATALLNYYPAAECDRAAELQLREFSAHAGADRRGGSPHRSRRSPQKQSAYARFSRKNITEDYANPLLPDDSTACTTAACWFLTPT